MDDPTGKGNIRGLNAAVGAPPVAFLIGERVLDVPVFKQATVATPFDDTNFVLNFDYLFSGDTVPTRLTSVEFKLVKDNDYLFIFTGSITEPSSMLWERSVRAWDGTETVMQVRFGHLSPQLGEVDFYLNPPGIIPVAGEALATLGNGNRSEATELPAGDYEFFITSKDNPSDILFHSPSTAFAASADYLLATFDPDPAITSPISVRLITENGVSVEVPNLLAPPSLRIIHAAFGTGAVDLFRDNDFSAPLISNLAHGDVSAEVAGAFAPSTYSFTPAGNIGTVLQEEDFGIADALRTTRFLLGPPGSLETLAVVDDTRQVDDTPRIRLVQLAGSQQFVDIYLVDIGTDIADVNPQFPQLFFKGNTRYVVFPAKTYEMYATLPGSKDVLAGPLAFTLLSGDVAHFMLLDTVDPNVLNLVKYEHLSSAAALPGPAAVQ